MVSLIIPTIVINQVMALHPFHCISLLPSQAPWPERRRRHWPAPCRWVRRTTPCFKIRILRHEWLISVIGSVFSVLRCPWRCIPNRTIKPHWPWWKCRSAFPWVSSNGYVVNKKSENKESKRKTEWFKEKRTQMDSQWNWMMMGAG